MLFPFLGAIGIVITGFINRNLREAVTLITSFVLVWIVFNMIPDLFDGNRPELVLKTVLPGINISFKIEPLGMVFSTLASSLWIVNSIYSIGYMRGNHEKHQTRFYFFSATSIGATIGIAFAGNLFTLFLFYEMLTLFTYPLISHKGDIKTVQSARVYLGILLTTSIGLFLPAIIWTYTAVGHGNFILGGIVAGKVEGMALGLLLALFVFGLAKSALIPFHGWLPAAMVAPTPVSAMLHSVAVVKAGVFSVMKIIIYIFGIDHLLSTPITNFLSYAAAFTIIIGSVFAIRQRNLKKMLAYSTISQLSYVLLAASILNPLAIIGAIIHIVAHAFGKITLFFASGAIYTASKKTELIELSGIGQRMPWTMIAFTVGALSMIGIPPTGGFISKWYILEGALDANNYIAIFTIIVSTVLNAYYFLPVIFITWFGEKSNYKKKYKETPKTVIFSILSTALLTLFLFVFNSLPIEIGNILLEAN